MEYFDRISIEEISKRDMLMILKALEYTGKSTNIDSFLSLKDSILNQLCSIAETTEEEFLCYLEK
ncbi:hypothetical protein FQB35_09130 [Crassaminicella thermophila]|uniref:Uncharacterized protein n=1 Tax=Crassaminicella thermophila TaxID=2599308 RepID=A0A5C0SFC4_CRATE|nr:hypothetical protein [Crassaminicella thermophila]QEK12476.1 hypothetical protein FQB35_09130 [Crassaminicella thermophila]